MQRRRRFYARVICHPPHSFGNLCVSRNGKYLYQMSCTFPNHHVFRVCAGDPGAEPADQAIRQRRAVSADQEEQETLETQRRQKMRGT